MSDSKPNTVLTQRGIDFRFPVSLSFASCFLSFITKWSAVLLESFHVALRRRRYVVKCFNVGKMNRRGSGEKISLKNICLHTDLALKSAWRSF